MTDYEKLYSGIGRAAWGYFFIYFNFNINSVSLLPAFVGYLLFLYAIGCLCEEERELSLLKVPCIILVLWHGASWLASFGAASIDGIFPFADIIVGAVNIYFHFQLITNLASIAEKHQPIDCELDEKLLSLRTLQTLMLTAVIIFGYFSKWTADFGDFISIGIIIIYLIAGILLMRTLFKLRRCFEEDTI